MHSKAWCTLKACIKNTFTCDGTHLRKPLGDWLHTVSSQHWAAYKTEDDYLFIAPDENNPTWVQFPPLSRNLHSLQYDIYNSTGAPCNPPQKTYTVSLSSASPHTLIYADSNSSSVYLKTKKKVETSQTDSAILRLLGPEIRQTGQ